MFRARIKQLALLYYICMIKIKYNPNADSRTMKVLPSKEEMKSINLEHIGDVSICLSYIINDILSRCNSHDKDKIEDIDGYYRDQKEVWENKVDFTELPWYKKHKLERHHRIDNDFLWAGMTVGDVVENMVDKVTATAARQGHLNSQDVIRIVDSINPNIFKLAMFNSLMELKDNIEIVGKDNE